jgi:hypothetical protein
MNMCGCLDNGLDFVYPVKNSLVRAGVIINSTSTHRTEE